jgi:hypothetical protein
MQTHRHSFFFKHTLRLEANTGFSSVRGLLRASLSPALLLACLLVTQLYVALSLSAASNSAVCSFTNLGLTALVAAQHELVLALLSWARLAWSLVFAPLHVSALWEQVHPLTRLLLDPATDLDLSTNTDSEDLLVFLSDVLEFVEQDRSFLMDAVFNSFSTQGLGLSVMGIEAYLLSGLRRGTLSSTMVKMLYK